MYIFSIKPNELNTPSSSALTADQGLISINTSANVDKIKKHQLIK